MIEERRHTIGTDVDSEAGAEHKGFRMVDSDTRSADELGAKPRSTGLSSLFRRVYDASAKIASAARGNSTAAKRSWGYR